MERFDMSETQTKYPYFNEESIIKSTTNHSFSIGHKVQSSHSFYLND